MLPEYRKTLPQGLGDGEAVLKLREYQKKAVNILYNALQSELSVLCQSPCGSGKTVFFSHLIKQLLDENPSFRILVLADVEIIVAQTRDKLIKVAPELMRDIG